MIFVQNISLHFAGNYLFENVSFRVNRGDKVGLVGKNGAGKSTLLKILAQEKSFSAHELSLEGSISTESEVSIGYLKQDLDFEDGRTLWDETSQAFSAIKQLEKEIESINTELAERTDYESVDYHRLIETLSEKTDYLNLIGGYHYAAKIEQILLGLGFKREEFDQPTQLFSGGWRMRIELAKLLLQEHDALLLDEPTNHLDIDSIIWLENFLRGYSGAVVLISHDVQFLNKVTNKTLEIANRKITSYAASYDKYLQLKDESRAILLSQQKNQEKSIKHTEQLIDKFKAKASKASMAQSLVKKLDRIERIEVDNDDVNTMKAAFRVHQDSGKQVLHLENVGKSFAQKNIFNGVNMLVTRGEKIAFVGQNGQGKSTLAQMIVGKMAGEGVIQLGHNVMLGYFAQEHHFDEKHTVLEAAEHAATRESFKSVRHMLGAFLFKGDDVHKKVSVLSGGERGRLALCNLLLNPFNTLILDEPTNHLDIQSKNILKQALEQFAGTLIVVSHDRDFMQGLIHKIYEFKDGKIDLFLGHIDEFLKAREAASFREIEQKKQTKASDSQKKSVPPIGKNDTRQKANQLKKVEREITDLEVGVKSLEDTIASNRFTPQDLADYEAKKRQLEQKVGEWEVLCEQ